MRDSFNIFVTIEASFTLFASFDTLFEFILYATSEMRRIEEILNMQCGCKVGRKGGRECQALCATPGHGIKASWYEVSTLSIDGLSENAKITSNSLLLHNYLASQSMINLTYNSSICIMSLMFSNRFVKNKQIAQYLVEKPRFRMIFLHLFGMLAIHFLNFPESSIRNHSLRAAVNMFFSFVISLG